MGIGHLEVGPEQLVKVCDPDELWFETTAEIEALEGTIGQERAISAQIVMGDHVDKAIDQRKYRSNLTEERLQEMIEEGTINTRTDGARRQDR